MIKKLYSAEREKEEKEEDSLLKQIEDKEMAPKETLAESIA